MKKTLIATAVAAGMLATGAAQADPTVYGILHFSINKQNDAEYLSATQTDVNDGLDMTSNTSAIGVKGSEDLGGGMKAIYKAEWLIDPFSTRADVLDNNGNTVASTTIGGLLQRRDIWVGLKGGWGKAAVGTMSTNYKQMGGKIDPMYRTRLEARGLINMQSPSHRGAGTEGQGRQERTLQYTTPKMAGIEIVLNTTVANKDGNQDIENNAGAVVSTIGNDETIGAGIRWSNKNFLVYLDYLDPNRVGSGAFSCYAEGTSAQVCENDATITKIGGKWSNKAFQVGAQYESTEDQYGGDYMYLSGLWNINNKNAVTAAYGQQDKISSGYSIAYVHSMSKQTNVYAGYGAVEADKCAADNSACSYELGEKSDGTAIKDNGLITFGIRKSF
jgi:predicted porin